MPKYQKYKYSIKIKTDDLTALYAIRAISMFSEKGGNNRIIWGGTGDKTWKKDNNSVVFRFTSSIFRENFKNELERLFKDAPYQIIEENDNNPK